MRAPRFDRNEVKGPRITAARRRAVPVVAGERTRSSSRSGANGFLGPRHGWLPPFLRQGVFTVPHLGQGRALREALRVTT